MLTENVNAGKRGAHVRPEKYQPVCRAILKSLPDGGKGLTWKELIERVAIQLPSKLFPEMGAIYWYVKTVQLDLEAKGLIERVPQAKPLRLRRVSSNGA